MSDVRERHLGRIASASAGSGIEVDVGVLVRRLMLFEHCVVESIRLTEVAALAAVFGTRGLLDLIDEGAVSLVCDALTIGEIGRTDLDVTDRRGGPLPLGSYRLAAVSMADRDSYLDSVLKEIDRVQLRVGDAKRFRRALAGRLLPYPRQAAESAVAVTGAEILDRPWLLGEAVRQVARIEIGRDPGVVDIETESVGLAGDYRIATSIGRQLGLDPNVEHRIVGRGLLSMSSVPGRGVSRGP